MIRRSILLLGTGLCCLAASTAHAAPTFTNLVRFSGNDGQDPAGPLIFDGKGNLYGTTRCGGAGTSPTHCGTNGNGAVFELAAPDFTTVKTLFNFNAGTGDNPVSGVVFDSHGNLFGATNMDGPTGFGGVYELSGANHGTFHDLQDFLIDNLAAAVMFGGSGQPYVPNQPYTSGHLFGTTNTFENGQTGTVFDLSGPNYGRDVLRYNFPTDQWGPTSPLLADAFGNLYGTTIGEQFAGSGPSTVFELSGPHHNTFRTLAALDENTTGDWPDGLSFDKYGNLYGATKGGGPLGGGTIFELLGPDHHQLKMLWGFTLGDWNGSQPAGSLIVDAAGNLFGVTTFGGIPTFYGDSQGGSLGTVFKLSSDHHTLTILHRFDEDDGVNPTTSLVADAAGNLFGTTFSSVFRISNVGFVPFSK